VADRAVKAPIIVRFASVVRYASLPLAIFVAGLPTQPIAMGRVPAWRLRENHHSGRL
jgi:hypothetical protein